MSCKTHGMRRRGGTRFYPSRHPWLLWLAGIGLVAVIGDWFHLEWLPAALPLLLWWPRCWTINGPVIEGNRSVFNFSSGSTARWAPMSGEARLTFTHTEHSDTASLVPFPRGRTSWGTAFYPALAAAMRADPANDDVAGQLELLALGTDEDRRTWNDSLAAPWRLPGQGSARTLRPRLRPVLTVAALAGAFGAAATWWSPWWVIPVPFLLLLLVLMAGLRTRVYDSVIRQGRDFTDFRKGATATLVVDRVRPYGVFPPRRWLRLQLGLGPNPRTARIFVSSNGELCHRPDDYAAVSHALRDNPANPANVAVADELDRLVAGTADERERAFARYDAA